MRKTFKVLGYLIAGEVVVQAMAIAYALAGLGYWINEEGGVLNKAVIDSEDADFGGIVGFMIHGINGMMIIPLLVIAFLVVSFFAKVAGGTRSALIVLGLVVLQVILGISSQSVPELVMLHVLNAFAIIVVALQAARGAGAGVAPVPADARQGASV